MGESSGIGDGSCQDATIVYAKIHPSIGIARVGNSRLPDSFYIGPQVVDPAPLPAENYRDSTGALKREVAQFRIYGYDGAGRLVQLRAGPRHPLGRHRAGLHSPQGLR